MENRPLLENINKKSLLNMVHVTYGMVIQWYVVGLDHFFDGSPFPQSLNEPYIYIQHDGSYL